MATDIKFGRVYYLTHDFPLTEAPNGTVIPAGTTMYYLALRHPQRLSGRTSTELVEMLNDRGEIVVWHIAWFIKDTSDLGMALLDLGNSPTTHHRGD